MIFLKPLMINQQIMSCLALMAKLMSFVWLINYFLETTNSQSTNRTKLKTNDQSTNRCGLLYDDSHDV